MALFTGIIGPPGSGKTCFLVAIFADAYNKGYPLTINVHLTFPHVYFPRETLPTLDTVRRGSYVGIDELGELADAYDFLSESSRGLSKLARQGRKEDLTIYYTVQHESLITARLRKATSRIFFCEDLDARKIGHRYENCNAQFLITLEERGAKGKAAFVFDGRPFQLLYNSRQRV